MSTRLMEAVSAFQRKQEAGVYPTESVSCFCGATEGTGVVTEDRYGLPYQVTLCASCGLLYQTPRLTPEATLRLYREDYRAIYDTEADIVREREHAHVRAETLLTFLDERFEWQPQRVLDVGCHDRRWWAPFLARGCQMDGFEIGEPWPNEQFDLILCNDVLEHVLDLEGFLEKVRAHLAPHGRLFVCVPGLFTWERARLWQHAHTYQFVGESLEYVMNCCGFKEAWLTEDIVSLWEPVSVRRAKRQHPPNLARTIERFLNDEPTPIPKIRVFNKFPIRERRTSITYALQQGHPEISTLQNRYKDGRAVIIGGGPSVDAQWDTVDACRCQGGIVFVIERMLAVTLAHAVMPDYVICLDASPDVLDSLADAPRDPTYLLAAQCPPSVWDRLRDYRCVLFHTPQPGIDLTELSWQAGYDRVTVVNAGASVTLGAMSLAMGLGCRHLDIFGFDCQVSAGAYATGIRGVGAQPVVIEARVDAARIQTTPAYLGFAQQFFYLMQLGRQLGLVRSVTVHGSSLVNAMMQPRWREQFEEQVCQRS